MDAEHEASEDTASLAACLTATPPDGECRVYRALFEARDFAPVAALVMRVPLGGDLYQTVVERVTEGVVQQTAALIDPVSVAVWLGLKANETPWRRDRAAEELHVAGVAWTQAQQAAQERQAREQDRNPNRLTVARSPLH